MTSRRDPIHAPGFATSASDSGIARARNICLLVVVGSALLLLGLAWLQPVLPPSHLTRDPLAVVIEMMHDMGIDCCSRKIGAISTLGVMLWSATAAVGFLAAVILRGLGAERTQIMLFTILCALSLWMALDDGLMLHETFSPAAFGLTATHFIPILTVLPMLFLIARTKAISGHVLLFGALGALAASVLIDDLAPPFEHRSFVEDAFKFVGQSLWAVFFTFAAVESIMQAGAQARMRGAPGRSGT